MATFGIEGIRYFSHLRASGTGYKAEDLTYVFNICNGLDEELRDAGHTRGFYWAETDCWEKDMRDASRGGIDDVYADAVDLFFIYTHGKHSGGHALLAYDIQLDHWVGSSQDWRFGDKWDLEWLLVYGCHTIDLNNPGTFWDVFQRLHEFCGSWGDMWDGITTDECGENVGDNLTDGETVVHSWIDGVGDWWVDNHPMVLAMERQSTWNGGDVDWPNTTMDRDHLWGHGTTVSDIRPVDKYWMSCAWAEG